jgi:hypothetical protein
MKRISWSPLFAKVFDVVWLSFMTVWTIGAVVASIMSHLALGVVAVGAGAFFWAIGFHSLKGDWRLVDEVFDAGDSLLVRKGSAERESRFRTFKVLTSEGSLGRQESCSI